MKRRRNRREGMALLTVLLLVAVMSVVAVAVLDDVRFSVRRTVNAETGAQAQWYAAGAEDLARRQIARLVENGHQKTPVSPDWNGRAFDFPIEDGHIRAVVRDGQACFNLNSVVEGQGEVLTVQPLGVAQLVALGKAVGVPEARMRVVADSLVDWMDADNTPRPLGAEDGAYAGQAQPYRTAGVMLAEVSELRAVKGVDADLYRRLRPFVCALPVDETRINANSLTEAQAPLLVMMTDGRLSLAGARAAIAARPADGWSDGNAFWNQRALSAVQPAPEVYDQMGVRTEFFAFRADIDYGGARAVRTALLHARLDGRVATVIQRWTPDE